MAVSASNLAHRLLALLVFFLFGNSQLFGQFTTVINIPSDPDISSEGDILSGTQVNLFDGGVIGSLVDLDSGSELNVFGGTVERFFDALTGSAVNISGGSIGSSFSAFGSEVNMSGGSIDTGFRSLSGSTVNVSGGSIGSRSSTSGSEVNISGGSIGSSFSTSGSEVNLSGGMIEGGFRIESESTVNVTGGAIGSSTWVRNGSLNLFGGSVGRSLRTDDNGVINFQGGAIDDGLDTFFGGEVYVFGENFRLNGQPIDGLGMLGDSLQLDLPRSFLLTGTLADGTPFAFSNSEGDSFRSGALNLVAAELPAIDRTNIQVPSDSAPQGVREGQTITVIQGGKIDDNFSAGSGSTTIIDGGTIGRNFEAVDADVTVHAGLLGNDFDAFDGSIIDISGGRVGTGFQAHAGSRVNLIGGEFRINGNPIFGLQNPGDVIPVSVPNNSVLSGTLADGTPFIFTDATGDSFAASTLALHVAVLPPKLNTIILNSGDVSPVGARTNQTIAVNQGGEIGDYFTALHRSEVSVSGGKIGNNFEAEGAKVTINDGSVGGNFQAYLGTTVDVYGGKIGEGLTANESSYVNIFNGSIGDGLTAARGGTINIIGGSVANDVSVSPGGTLNLFGGSMGDRLLAYASDDPFESEIPSVNIYGSEFRINGISIEGLENLGDSVSPYFPSHSVLSGILSDGTPFAFVAGTDIFESGVEESLFRGSSLTLNRISTAGIGPSNITVPNDTAPKGIRMGQTLVVEHGGLIPENFNAAPGSMVVINGGEIAENFEAEGAHVVINGGTIGEYFDAFAGTTVDIFGGVIGSNFQAFAESEINIYGRDFKLEFTELQEQLVPNVPFRITTYYGKLSGILDDGTPFSFQLDYPGPGVPDFDANAVINVILLVPEPTTGILLLIASMFLAHQRNRK